MRALLCLAFLPGLRSFAPTPRRHRIQLKSVEDVHGDEVLAPTEELSTPSSDFVAPAGIPANSASVGRRSIAALICGTVEPAGIWPGQPLKIV